MFTRLALGLFLVSLPLAAAAETRIETVLGTVIKQDSRTETVLRKTPTTEQVCRDVDVPVYAEAKSGESDLGAMIVGGLIGSALGNKMSDSNGGGAAGAVAGAIVGGEISKNANKQGKIVGYQRQSVCENRSIILTENVQQIIGYRLTVEADGRILTLDVPNSYQIGERVEIRKQITYSVR